MTLHLQVPDMDSARRLVHVRCGTGAKDRYVPLPQRTLALRRQSWATHRPPVWLVPAPGRGAIGMATASAPMPRASMPEALRVARKASGLHTRASVHTLRHAWATPLLAAGVPRRLIQAYGGHKSPTTTSVDTHVTVRTAQRGAEAVHRLMSAR